MTPKRGGKTRRLLILGWHNVEGTCSFPAPPGAGRRGLESQLKTLSRFAHVVPLGWALQRLGEGGGLPSRAVAITFDDGYADVLTDGVPLLESYGLPATFFLVPGFLSGRETPWWEDLASAISSATRSTIEWDGSCYCLDGASNRARSQKDLSTRLQHRTEEARKAAMNELLDRLGAAEAVPELLMDWDGARELLRRGFDVQSHTYSHPVLSAESAPEQHRNLQAGRDELERELNLEITTVAYPHGTPAHYNAETVQAARDSGYRWGVTTREGFSDSKTPEFELRRCVMYPERGTRDLIAQMRYLGQKRSR